MKKLTLGKLSLYLFTGILVTVGLINCGGGSSSATTAEKNAYTGAGSKWDINTDESANTFVITRREDASSAVDLTINGTFTNETSGFKLLTVTSATGTDAPSAGDMAFGLEVPGYAFFLRPTEDSGELITMIASGSCPTANYSGNWITVKNIHDITIATDQGGTSQDASNPSSEHFGTFTWDNTNSTLNLLTQYSLVNPTTDLNRGEAVSFTCSDGVATITTPFNATLYLTTNGGAIVHTDNPNGDGVTKDESIIASFTSEELTSVTDFDGNYAGVLVVSNSSDASSVQALSATCSAGTCIGNTINATTNTATGTTATINLTGNVNEPSNGFVNGTITIGPDTSNITCMVDTKAAGTTKNLISCSGQSPNDTTELFNIILVTK